MEKEICRNCDFRKVPGTLCGSCENKESPYYCEEVDELDGCDKFVMKE